MKRRNLTVGMRGDDVARVSKKFRLGDNPVFTRQLGDAVLAWKYRAGFDEKSINTGMGTRAQAVLFGEAKRTPAEYARAKVRGRFQIKRTKAAKKAAPTKVSLRIIPREEWGAKSPKSPFVWCAWNLPALWIHHSAGAAPKATLAAEMATVRAIQAFHQGPSRNWNDIGYAFLVGQSGNVYEGRGLNHVAAHCPGHNSEPSLCFMLADEEPSDAALAAAKQLQAKLGKSVLRPHRAGFNTSCPGDKLVAELHLS